eukprot:5777651-Amphidinium_carterae.1
MGGANPDVLTAMTWAEAQADTIADAPQTDEHRRHKVYSQQLYLALSLQVADASDAMVKRMNVPNYNGLEGWRQLKRHYEPLTRGNMRLRMDRLLRPTPAERLDQCLRVIETWEKDIREYETRFNK